MRRGCTSAEAVVDPVKVSPQKPLSSASVGIMCLTWLRATAGAGRTDLELLLPVCFELPASDQSTLLGDFSLHLLFAFLLVRLCSILHSLTIVFLLFSTFTFPLPPQSPTFSPLFSDVFLFSFLCVSALLCFRLFPHILAVKELSCTRATQLLDINDTAGCKIVSTCLNLCIQWVVEREVAKVWKSDVDGRCCLASPLKEII